MNSQVDVDCHIGWDCLVRSRGVGDTRNVDEVVRGGANNDEGSGKNTPVASDM